MLRFCTILCLLSLANSADLYDLKFVGNEEALCLDGTKSVINFKFCQKSLSHTILLEDQIKVKLTFYFSSKEEGKIETLLHFILSWIGGNNVEETLQNAYDRTNTWLGTSKTLPNQKKFGGFFSRESAKNPLFYNWNTLILNYCDGTGHQGYAAEPIEVNGRKLYFRGETIVKSIIQEVFQLLSSSRKVLVAGCSAGGQATLQWVQHFRDILPQTVQVLAQIEKYVFIKSAPDSGLFLDMETIDNTFQPYRQFYMKNFMQIANVEVDPPNQYCVQANQQEKWKCLISPYLLEYIKVPIFFVQSHYDSWSIEEILKSYCVNDRTLRQCSTEQLSYIEVHHQNSLEIMQRMLEKQSEWGAWSPSCINHWYKQQLWKMYQFSFLNEDGRFNEDYYRVPSQVGLTLNEAISKWVITQDCDNSNIDIVDWPGNEGCATI